MEDMKNAIVYIALLILCCSCGKPDNAGWPKKVVFTKEGGEIVLKGGKQNDNWHFVIDGEHYFEDVTDDGYMKKDWLSVRIFSLDGKLGIKADPLSGDNVRHLALYQYGMYGTHEIGVYQYPKDSVQLGLKPQK